MVILLMIFFLFVCFCFYWVLMDNFPFFLSSSLFMGIFFFVLIVSWVFLLIHWICIFLSFLFLMYPHGCFFRFCFCFMSFHVFFFFSSFLIFFLMYFFFFKRNFLHHICKREIRNKYNHLLLPGNRSRRRIVGRQ